jgi:hypothetical protein
MASRSVEASAFFAVVEQQPGAAAGSGASEGTPGRECVLELRGTTQLRLWHVDAAAASDATALAFELDEVRDVIVGFAASHAHTHDAPAPGSADGGAHGGAPRLHPFGIVFANSPPLLLASPCARERALIAAAVGAARDARLGLPVAQAAVSDSPAPFPIYPTPPCLILTTYPHSN